MYFIWRNCIYIEVDLIMSTCKITAFAYRIQLHSFDFSSDALTVSSQDQNTEQMHINIEMVDNKMAGG